MNMIMDNNHHTLQHQHQPGTPPMPSPQRPDLHISTTPPNHSLSPIATNNNNISSSNNNNSDSQMSPATTLPPNGKSSLKRSFDVAFLMMPDERIKQKQAEKQARLAEFIERHQYPTDLSPRTHQLAMQQQQQQQQQLQHLQEQVELLNAPELRRYPQITVRAPRVYDDPTLVIPGSDSPEALPLKSAFTKVASTRLESPVQPAPPLSPDQLSCSSMSPPVATTPPRTNSGNGSLSNGSNNSAAPPPPPPSCLNPNIVYQHFRPEYQFNGAFQSVNQVQALQAQRIKQQLLYRPPLNATTSNPSSSPNSVGAAPPEFLHGYPAFPFPPGAGPHPFVTVGPPELPRIVQNPAAAAILSTLIPPTLASTFTLTAQNVCAKCNISFRMTSDLVYHMRSHHKSEVACDPNRRKREEKLKCPVCQESFRERHHLTRHMTAHQDKESDKMPNGPPANSELINVGSSGSGGSGSSRQHAARATGASK